MNNAEQVGFKPNNGGDPASPVQGFRDSPESLKLYGQLFHGLTKREHFAAMALQGMLVNPNEWMGAGVDIPILAVVMADSLLKALDNINFKDNQ